MGKLKKVLNHIFIEGLSGMALGLFATLVVGTIIQQIGKLIGGAIGEYLFLLGKIAGSLTGAGIGVGVAYKFKESPLVVVSAATAGMAGGFAGKILAGSLLKEGSVILSGPGEPLGAFIAAYVGIILGHLVSGKTKVDILVTPIITVLSGSIAGILAGPPISAFLSSLGEIVNWGTEQHPLLMGIVVSVIMGMVLTLPISSAALGIILNLSGLAAGAATVGCCCQMVGFGVASYRENKAGGLIAQGIGTSMLQISNIYKNPRIWIPPTLASAILGPVGIRVFNMTNNATGSGMGTSGFVGQIMTWQTMSQTENTMVLIAKILLMHFILPAILALIFSEYMRKKNLIKFGDMKLDL